MKVERSPAGAMRERSVPCVTCGAKTFNHGRVCGFCLPDGHECAALDDEYLSERYDRA